MKKFSFYFLFICCLYSQNKEEILTKIKKTNLTSSQINELIRKSDQIKASKEKLEASNENEINFQQKSVNSKNSNKKELSGKVENPENEIKNDEVKIIENLPQTNKKPVINFGYKIFKNDPSIFQASSFGGIDPYYNIGPGDKIIIMLWGETQFRQIFTVDKEGYIFNTDLGQIFVNGLTLNKLEEKLFKYLSKVYSSLSPSIGNATTFLDISIGELRPLRIMVLGEVLQPGAYSVPPATTLFSSLYYFNGPSENGSLREIQLIRKGEIIKVIDFYNYLLKGETRDDIRLQLDDIIFIPNKGKSVTILGEITKSAIYEIKDDGTLKDLINISGGLKSTAFLERAQIDRIVPFEERDSTWNDRVLIDFDLSEDLRGKSSIKLQDGDIIKIFSINDIRSNDVTILGKPVKMPGSYQLSENMTVNDLIEKSGGLDGSVYMKKANITRSIIGDFQTKLISIDLDKVIKNNSEHNIKLNWKDTLHIFSSREMIPSYKIQLEGHVKKPGVYKLNKDMTIYDVVFEYGGFLDKEWKEKTFLGRVDLTRLNTDGITRKNYKLNLQLILNNPNSDENFILQPGDNLTIYPKSYFNYIKPVLLNGEVANPGIYDFKNNMTIKDIIIEAGGLKNELFKYKIEISRIDTLNDEKDKFAEIIDFDIESSFFNKSNYDISNNKNRTNNPEDFKLEPYDMISVRPDPNFYNQQKIQIGGAVNYSGYYSLQSSEETIGSIIDRAGGLKENHYINGLVFLRNGKNIKLPIKLLLGKNLKKNSFKLQNGDNIFVPFKPQTVNIIGHANDPGYRLYIKGKPLKYYLSSVGGLRENADKNIIIKYPNGETKKVKRFQIFTPEIIDGSEIIINKIDEKEPLDKTEFAKEIASIIADLVQVLTVFSILKS